MGVRAESVRLVPRKGLEPPRCYSLVPETSASTNSATWAFRKAEDHIKKNTRNTAGLLEEFTGVVEGHRDGHGFVIRDDGQSNVYLSPNEMRAVLHRDCVVARVTRIDNKGRPEGRILEIVQRDRKSTRLNSSHVKRSRMPSSA